MMYDVEVKFNAGDCSLALVVFVSQNCKYVDEKVGS